MRGLRLGLNVRVKARARARARFGLEVASYDRVRNGQVAIGLEWHCG